jgi:hypothetical protein
VPRNCDLRCRTARGRRCACWCGGRYHGGGPQVLERMARDFGLDLSALGPNFALADPGAGQPLRLVLRTPAAAAAPPRRARRAPSPQQGQLFPDGLASAR